MAPSRNRGRSVISENKNFSKRSNCFRRITDNLGNRTMERNHLQASSEKNVSTRPLSAWEKRRAYSQQLYQKNKSCINQHLRNPVVLKKNQCAFMTNESEYRNLDSTDEQKMKRNSSKHKINGSFTISCGKSDINDKNVHLDTNLSKTEAAELSSSNLNTCGTEDICTGYPSNDNRSSSNSKKRRRTSTYEKNKVLVNSSEDSEVKMFPHELTSSAKKRQRLSTNEKKSQQWNVENSNKYQKNEFSCRNSKSLLKKQRSSIYDKETNDKSGKKKNITLKGSAQLETKKKAGIKSQRCSSKSQHVRMTPPKPGGGSGTLVGTSIIKRNLKPKMSGMHIPSANCTKICSDLNKTETSIHLGSNMHIPLDPIPKNLPVKERLRVWKERKQQTEYNRLQNIQTQKLKRQSAIPAETKPQELPAVQKRTTIAHRGLSKHTRSQKNPVTVRQSNFHNSNSLKTSKMLVAPVKNKDIEKTRQKTSLLEEQSQGISQKKESVSKMRNLATTQGLMSTTYEDFKKDKGVTTMKSNLGIMEKTCNEKVQLDTPKCRSLTFIKDRPTPGITKVTLSGFERNGSRNANNSDTSSKETNKFCNNNNITKFELQNKRKGNQLVRHSISHLYRKGQLCQVNNNKRKTISSLPIKEELKVMNKGTENLVEENKEQKATILRSGRSKRKNVSFYLQDDKPDMSSHKLPKTPVRDFTLRERLENWLDNKGRSISHYRHLHCFGHQLSDFKRKKSLHTSPALKVVSNRIEEEENIPPSSDLLGSSPVLRPRTPVKTVVGVSVEKTLTELKSLLEEGHPPSYISNWLDEVVKHVPFSETTVQFWECRALVAEKNGDYETAVEILNTALDKGVEPVEDLKSVVSSLRARIASRDEKKDTTEENMIKLDRTPKSVADLSASKKKRLISTTPRQPLVDKANMFESTLIQYSLSHHKSLFERISENLDIKAIVTPVRRSSRLSVTPLSEKRSQETSLKSLTELPFEVREKVFFYHNDALGEKDFE